MAPDYPVPVAGHLAHETAQAPRADMAANLAQGEGRAERVEEVPLEDVRLVARVLLDELPRPLGRLRPQEIHDEHDAAGLPEAHDLVPEEIRIRKVMDEAVRHD